MATPQGPSQKPCGLLDTLRPSNSQAIGTERLQAIPISESHKDHVLKAYMRDCVDSMRGGRPRRDNSGKKRTRRKEFPTETALGDRSSCERPSTMSDSAASSANPYSSASQAKLADHEKAPRVVTMVSGLLTAGHQDGRGQATPESQRNIRNSDLWAEPQTLTGLSKRLNLGSAPSFASSPPPEPEPIDYFNEGPRNLPEVWSNVPDRIVPSETESLHLPIIITDSGKASKQQLVEIQDKDSNVNRERVSSCFDLVDRGPEIPDIVTQLVQNTRVNRFEEITIEDVRNASLIGQFDRSFLALAKDSAGTTLLLIDQHALHERILLEQLEDECFRNADQPTPTVILAPKVIVRPKDPAQIQLVKRDTSMMERHGFLVETPQNEVITVQTAPRCLSTKDAEKLRRTTTSLFEEFIRGSETFSAVFHRVLKSKACHSAIKCPKELDK